MTLTPLADLIAVPHADRVELVNPNVSHLLDLYERRLEPEVSHRDPDGSVVLQPRYGRGAFIGWAMHLPWEKNPLPKNRNGRRGGGHWSDRAKQVRFVRQVAYSVARNRIPPQPRIRIGLAWEVTDRIHRDEDNLSDLMKALTDGLRDAAVVPDDTAEFVARTYPEIHFAPAGPTRPAPHFIFRIEPIRD